MSRFRLYDIVMLKSGGPPMTITGREKAVRVEAALADLLKKGPSEHTSSENDSGEGDFDLECSWFTGNTLRRAEFSPDALVEATFKPPPTSFVDWLKQEHEDDRLEDKNNVGE